MTDFLFGRLLSVSARLPIVWTNQHQLAIEIKKGAASKFVTYGYDYATMKFGSIKRYEGADASGPMIAVSRFGYDAMGRLTSLDHFDDDDRDGQLDAGETLFHPYVFQYDVLSRITKITSGAIQREYKYDVTGQLTCTGRGTTKSWPMRPSPPASTTTLTGRWPITWGRFGAWLIATRTSTAASRPI
jgi:hypothetical protein